MPTPPTAKVVKFNPHGWWMGIAASLTLILIAGNYWVQNLPENLYEEKYIAYQIPTMRSNGEEGEELEEDFKNKNWDSVIRSVSLKDNNRKNLFLAGVSYFESGDFTNSLKYLNKLEEINSSSTDRLFEDETDYYLFLNHLKSKNYNKALFFLQKITSDPTHSYHNSFDKKDWVKLQVMEVFKP
jgi:tetratricopeptide (TPR) repeat protein